MYNFLARLRKTYANYVAILEETAPKRMSEVFVVSVDAITLTDCKANMSAAVSSTPGIINRPNLSGQE